MRTILRNPYAISHRFTREEMFEMWRDACVRQLPKENNPFIRNRTRYGDDSYFVTHFVGILGEKAFSEFSGIPYDRKGYMCGDQEKDFVLPDGRTVEVKTLLGYLAFNKNRFDEYFRANIAVLAIHSKGEDGKIIPEVSLEGWITKKRFLECCFVDDFGYGERLCVQPIDLFSMKTLMLGQGTVKMLSLVDRLSL